MIVKLLQRFICSSYTNYHLNCPQARILFSTWNLDHQVERSRSVVPALVEAVRGRRRGAEVNTEYFYQLLFTRANLRLVHIVCHDKQEHTSMKCDKKQFYLK